MPQDTPPADPVTAAHALLTVLAGHGVDRVFMVPGESYLDLLNALHDFPAIDVVSCRHEGGAGFMACADARLTRRAAVLMVSRGPGASNAAISVHTAQQDGVPLVLIVGQVARRDLGRDAFQEIDYRQMYGSIAKWVFQVTDPAQVAEATFKALRVAESGAPGPVVLVLPEDVQHQPVPRPQWRAAALAQVVPAAGELQVLQSALQSAQRPLLIAGGAFEAPGGREALLAFAEQWGLPVAVSLRRHDIFPNRHPQFLGHLGHGYPPAVLEQLQRCDLVLAIGTRLGDITTQGFEFPRLPVPGQTLVHCHADSRVVGWNFAPAQGLVCDPVALLQLARPAAVPTARERFLGWAEQLHALFEKHSQWPPKKAAPNDGGPDGIDFAQVVRELYALAPADLVLCVDGGAFTVPAYRYVRYTPPQRLLGPLAGAMGYGVPAAVAAQLRLPDRKVVCLVGDGGFMMNGNEMILAAERRLPILFILANNASYGSIRVHQEQHYPGRTVGTNLHNPDFAALAAAFGIRSRRIERDDEIAPALREGLAADEPVFLDVRTSLQAILPRPR